MNTSLSQRIQINDRDDILSFDGVRFSGGALTQCLQPSPEGRWYRIKGVENGTLVIETKVDTPATAADTPATA